MKRIKFLVVGGLTIFELSVQNAIAQVGINEPNPDESAVLEPESNTRGLLPPRMGTQRREEIVNPADGLMVFDTDYDMYMVYSMDEGKWHGMSPLRFNVTRNNTSVATYEIYADDQVGNVGIGVDEPSEKLHVDGAVSIGNNNVDPPADGLYVKGQAKMDDGLDIEGVVGTTSGGNQYDNDFYRTIFFGQGAVPIGGIIMWSGSPNQVPDGWELCDGAVVGRPDLRGKFVVGYDPDVEDYDGGEKEGGEKEGGEKEGGEKEGGEKEITLSEDQMPSHYHNAGDGTNGTLTIEAAGDHRHEIASTCGTCDQSPPHNSMRGITIDSNNDVEPDRNVLDEHVELSGSHEHSIIGNTTETGGGEPHERQASLLCYSIYNKS